MLKSFWLIVSVLTISSNAIAQTHSHQHHNQKTEQHSHSDLEVTPNQPIPSVTLNVIPDRKLGWNLQLKTTNFRIAPDKVNSPNMDGEGHAHLLINGEKITRIYGEWFYIKTLPSGKNTLTVTLNSNKHQQLVHQGKQISSSQIVVVPERAR